MNETIRNNFYLLYLLLSYAQIERVNWVYCKNVKYLLKLLIYALNYCHSLNNHQTKYIFNLCIYWYSGWSVFFIFLAKLIYNWFFLFISVLQINVFGISVSAEWIVFFFLTKWMMKTLFESNVFFVIEYGLCNIIVNKNVWNQKYFNYLWWFWILGL